VSPVVVGTAQVSRDELSLPPLVADGTTYAVADAGIADATVTWEDDQVSSPFVEGTYITHGVRGMVAQQMAFRVRGTSQTDLQTNIAALLAAFSQKTFTVELAIGGANYAWACRRRSYSVRFDRAMLFATVAYIQVAFERFPTALAGPF
jgi:hypothetical protein